MSGCFDRRIWTVLEVACLALNTYSPGFLLNTINSFSPWMVLGKIYSSSLIFLLDTIYLTPRLNLNAFHSRISVLDMVYFSPGLLLDTIYFSFLPRLSWNEFYSFSMGFFQVSCTQFTQFWGCFVWQKCRNSMDFEKFVSTTYCGPFLFWFANGVFVIAFFGKSQNFCKKTKST